MPSNKQKVKYRFQTAYSVRYSDTGNWFIYKEPAKAMPRGHWSPAVTIGTGITAANAWLDAWRRCNVTYNRAIRHTTKER